MRRSAVFAVRAAASVAAAIGIWWLCVLPYRAARIEDDVQQRSDRADAARNHEETVVLARQNLRELDGIASERRLSATWYMLYAGNCELLERWSDAIDGYTRALRIDQRPEIYFSRGFARMHAGDMNGGVADLVTAVRFRPFLVEQLDGELRTRVSAAAGIH